MIEISNVYILHITEQNVGICKLYTTVSQKSLYQQVVGVLMVGDV